MKIAVRSLGILALLCWIPTPASICQPDDVDRVLSCGDAIVDTTVAASAVLEDYPCGSPFSDLPQEGPERIYEFTPQQTGTVEIIVDDQTTDHDLYVIENCNTADCVAGSTHGSTNVESVFFDASQGSVYQIVVEPYSDLGNFLLVIGVGTSGCPEDCDDSLDNDNDGDIDCDDSDCGPDPACSCTDFDEDGLCSDVDCDDGDQGVFAIPVTVTGLGVDAIPAGHRYAWDDQAASAGPATRYDVFSGELADLDSPGISAGACLHEDRATPNFDDFRTPPAGTGLYLLVRGENACGVGGYGSAARDAAVTASATSCLP